jgi:vacuolar-type H+-ATPase subunit I/STV1
MWKNKAMIRGMRWVMLVCGLFSVIIGLAVHQYLPSGEQNLIMLMGMLVGTGSAFITVAAYGFVMNARMTPEQKKQSEIDLKDERNIMIRGKALKASSIATSVFFTGSAFVMVGLGHRAAAYLCIGGMYIQVIAMALAQMYYQKKM